MINRQALVNSKEYWLVQMQAALYEQVALYMRKHQLSQTDFAKQLGVSKGYVSQ
jgi:predicted transcriptional regulator